MKVDDQRSYRFGPRDTRGLVLGVRPGQAALVSIALIVAVGALRAIGSQARVVVVVVDLVVGLSAAFVPVRGRTLGEWIPIAVGFIAAGAAGRRRELPTNPNRSARRRPSAFSAFSLIDVDVDGGRRIGAVADRRSGTLTGALLVVGSAFVLLDDAERERDVAGWASVLSALATSPLAPVRVQWIERTVPDRRQPLHDRVEEFFGDGPAAEERGDAVVRAKASYAALVAAESADSICHECVVAVSVRSRDRTKDRSGGVGGGDGPARLTAAMSAVEERMRSVGIDVPGALTPRTLERYLGLAVRDTGISSSCEGPWPIACEANWGSFRTDALLHATYWIAEWPRSDVSSEFLLPLLHDSGGRRTITVVMEPVKTSRATRRAEHARTSVRADNEIRSRHGFSQTARTSRQHDAVIRREEELASGHAGYRFSGYITVSAPDPASLERACSRVEQAGALARLELRRLFGSQDSAFCYTLPVGRGCG